MVEHTILGVEKSEMSATEYNDDVPKGQKEDSEAKTESLSQKQKNELGSGHNLYLLSFRI